MNSGGCAKLEKVAVAWRLIHDGIRFLDHQKWEYKVKLNQQSNNTSR